MLEFKEKVGVMNVRSISWKFRKIKKNRGVKMRIEEELNKILF